MILRTHQVVAFVVLVICAATFQPVAQAEGVPALTDPEIVGILVVANQIDVNYGKLALSKSKNKVVRDLAQQMINDHSALQKDVLDLNARLKVSPADSDNSKSLKLQSEETTKKLNALEGNAFDEAYLDNEVAFHLEVINANALVLIPNAQNAELKAALNGAQLHFQRHVQHAGMVKETLKGDTKKSATSAVK